MTMFARLLNLCRGLSVSVRRRAGVTLVELMIAMAILTIGVIALAQTFAFVQKAVQSSKNRTLGSNLAQEKMQILKQKTYYQVVVTSDPAHNDQDFAPESIAYDTGYFPPEQLTEGGVVYTRYTYVESLREDSGVVGPVAPNLPDTGMKRITVTVTWGYGAGGKRKVTLRSILANPDTVMANVVFNGVVKSTAAAPVLIKGALVSLVQVSGCADTTNAAGQYNMTATPGSFTLLVSATGYYSALKNVVIAAGATQTNDFPLTKIAVGAINGYPWLIDHLVISQVVGSTVVDTTVPDFDQEYVEVFNPTPDVWTVRDEIGLKFQRSADLSKKTVQIDYLTDDIPSGGYYLFANTGTVIVAGVSVAADAVWADGNLTSGPGDFPYFNAQKNIIPVKQDSSGPTNEGSGALELYRVSTDGTLDKVGWNRDGVSQSAPFYETATIPFQNAGLEYNELYARRTSTSDAAGVNWNFGPAYDTNNNSVDFHNYSAVLTPHNSDATKSVISGTPAAGAVVACSDGLSASAEAVLTGNPPYASFSLGNVATGYWSVVITSGGYALEKDSNTVGVPTAGSVYTCASTFTLLSSVVTTGFVTGRVVNVLGAALPGIVVTSGGSNNTFTDASGRFRLRVSSGTVDLIANSGGAAPSYVSASSNSISVAAGAVHSGVNFVLYEGGRISGRVIVGGNAGLPGVAVAIQDYYSNAVDVQVTGTDGRFTSIILSTGLYTARPSLGILEQSTPESSTVTIVTAGGTVNPNTWRSTFTITNAMGAISGTVRFGGQPIKSGVLIVVTTVALAGVPPLLPDISSNTKTGPPYYMVSSVENGTYLADVRSNAATYKVHAYYPVTGSTGTVIYSSSALSVPVNAGQISTGWNFSW